MKKMNLLVLVLCMMPLGLAAEDAKQGVAQDQAIVTPPVDAQEKAADTQFFSMRLDVDYTSVNMKQANDSMNAAYNINKFGSAIIGTLDMGFVVNSFLTAGPKAGYLYCFPASYERNYAGPLNFKTVMDASLIPLEAGATLKFNLADTSVSISTGAYAGVGLAHVANSVDVTNAASQKVSYVQPFDGFGFCGELNAAIELKLSKGIDFNINGGYRLANIDYVTQSKDVHYTFDGITTTQIGSKGLALRDAGNTNVPFDFSGLNIGVGISMGF